MTTGDALAGLIVTEFGGRGAAAVCGQLLMHLGATVIAIEDAAGETAKGAHRTQYMLGKRSVVPDPAEAADRELVASLIRGSDIVITSSDTDAPWQGALLPAAPDNVICDITAFGAEGPLAGTPYSEVAVQAFSGIMDTTGYPDGPPVPIRVPIIDVVTGTYAATAALAAHRVRREQGVGQRIDMALFDGAFASLRTFLNKILTSEKSSRSRLGNRHPTVAPWNLYRSLDGFVLICAGNTLSMFERLCKLIGHPDLAAKYPTQKDRIGAVAQMDPAIESWTRHYTTADCVERLLAEGVVSGPIAPVDAFPEEANLDFRGMIRRAVDPAAGREVFVPGSPIRMGAAATGQLRVPAPDADRAEVMALARDLAPVAAPAVRSPLRRPLEGVRILEFGQYTTAPMCARELAHLGAEVIKIENPAAAESRQGADQINGLGVSFRMGNADKRTMVVDLKNEFDTEAFRRLLATADVLVENLKPGTLSKFGFTPSSLQAINPRLIYCPITGFGSESLYPARPAFDMVITAMGGFMSVLSADGLPLKSGISTADIMGADMAMVAILAALEQRDRTGEAPMIDLSMQDVTAWLTQTAWNHAFAGRTEPAVVEASDGYVLVEAGEQALAEALHESPAGVSSVEELQFRSREDVAGLLGRRGLAAVPVQTVREAANLPHTIARKLWFTMPEDGFDWPMLASPLRLEKTPPTVRYLAVPMNHDRDALLREVGLSEAADCQAALEASRIGS